MSHAWDHPGIDVMCSSCSTPAPGGARFCGQCGSALPTPCPQCAELADPGTAFCTACGEPLQTPATQVPSLSGPQEERRWVSVLAVDLVGFSASAQTLEPEDLQAAQRSFFSVVAAAVLKTGGVVAKRIGDAVVAVYGAPTAHENDPDRAVAAALETQTALATHVIPGGRPLVARAGVSTGEAIVTFEPDSDVPQVAGEVLTRAMALQAAAPPGGVLVGRQTHRMTAPRVLYAEHEPLRVGSEGESETVWVAQGFAASVRRSGETLPLVGREPELGLLVSSVRRVMQERRGQLVTLVGEPGIGKSRLTRALFEHLDSPATPALVRWRVGQCLPYGEGVTYWALSSIVKAQASILESDNGAVARAKLDLSVDRVLPRTTGPETAAQVKERLAALLGLPGAGSDPSDDVEGSHAAWRRYLLGLAEDTPTVLVLEDLHAADDGLLQFLRTLVEGATSSPLLVLCTARPELMERRSDWLAGLRDAMTITLTPLAEPETVSVLARLLGEVELPEPLLRRMLDRVGGNPLYAEEYVRMLADSGVLHRSEHGEGFALGGSVDILADLPLPDSVQGVVDSRLDLLSAAERSVVSAAAVVGEIFWEGAVAAVADADRDEVLRCLEALERREVVRQSLSSSVEGEHQFAFRHVLVRDAAYSRIPRSVRVVQHRRCADWIEHLARERGADLAELRAHHRTTAYEQAAVRGADLEPYAKPAREALTSAAEHALRLHAVSAAHGFARRAVMLWYGHEDDAGALQATLLEMNLAFLDDPHAFYTEGGPAKLEETAEKLLALGDRAGAARAEGLLGQAEWYRRGTAGLADKHLQRAVDLMAEEPASEQSATALAELGRYRMLNHQYAEAVALSDRAMAVARPLGLVEVEANALITAGTARYSLGDPLGIVQQEEALRLARQHNLRALQRAANNLAATMQEEGRLRRSYELIEESARAARGWGLSLTTRADDSEIALMAWYDADWDRLVSHTEAFLATAGEEAQQWETHLVALASVVHTMRRQPIPEHLERVLERSRHTAFPAIVRSSLVLLGAARLLEGRVEEAEAMFEELIRNCQGNLRGNVREWASSAVMLSSFLGGGRLEQIRDVFATLEPKTPWIVAADHMALSLLASADGKHHDATEHAIEAVTLYERIGDASTVTWARIRLARAAFAAGDLVRSREQSDLVRAFVAKSGATRFLDYLPDQEVIALEVSSPDAPVPAHH
jgi:class 3 adenylate cyclase/tetratricopeptide (TPR) repeat protein